MKLEDLERLSCAWNFPTNRNQIFSGSRSLYSWSYDVLVVSTHCSDASGVKSQRIDVSSIRRGDRSPGTVVTLATWRCWHVSTRHDSLSDFSAAGSCLPTADYCFNIALLFILSQPDILTCFHRNQSSPYNTQTPAPRLCCVPPEFVFTPIFVNTTQLTSCLSESWQICAQ